MSHTHSNYYPYATYHHKPFNHYYLVSFPIEFHATGNSILFNPSNDFSVPVKEFPNGSIYKGYRGNTLRWFETTNNADFDPNPLLIIWQEIRGVSNAYKYITDADLFVEKGILKDYGEQNYKDSIAYITYYGYTHPDSNLPTGIILERGISYYGRQGIEYFNYAISIPEVETTSGDYYVTGYEKLKTYYPIIFQSGKLFISTDEERQAVIDEQSTYYPFSSFDEITVWPETNDESHPIIQFYCPIMAIGIAVKLSGLKQGVNETNGKRYYLHYSPKVNIDDVVYPHPAIGDFSLAEQLWDELANSSTYEWATRGHFI